MTSDNSTSSETETTVPAVSRKTGWRRIVWRTVLLTAACLVVGFGLFQTMLRPSVLEQEIRLDLITSDDIDEDARISVLNELKLFKFYTRFGPQRFATLCVQKSDGSLYLAFARCWREGMLWRTDTDRWKRISAWPTRDDVKSFEDGHADLVARAVDSGYRPRPPGTEDFQVSHLSIRVSKDLSDFNPNDGIDPAEFAKVLKHGIAPGSFAYAKFHKPRWHSPKEGIDGVEKSTTHLLQVSGQPECRKMDCEALLKVLHAVKAKLIRADELGLKFYFLATDQTPR